MPSVSLASWWTARAARSILACALLLTPAGALHAQDPEPAIVELESPSGASVVVATPESADEGRVSLRLVIARGASADPIGGSGATHVLSHALWDSAMDRLERRAAESNEGASEAAALLRAMEGRRHTHRAAPIDMFSLTFAIDLTDADDATVSAALRLLARVASLDDLTDDAILRARDTVRKELRGWTSPYLRVNQRATRAIFEPLGIPPGPFVGRDEEVAALEPDDLRALAQSLFAEGAATLIAVGRDADANAIAAEFTPSLAPRPAWCPMVVLPHGPGSRSIVVRDDEATTGVVELIRVERADIDRSGALLRDAASKALSRRVEIAAADLTGDEALSGLIVISKPFAPGSMGAPGVWLNLAHAVNAPGSWEHALRVLAEELRRIELHGYTEREARIAAERALEPFRNDERDERAGETRDVADRLARAVAMGHPRTTARQALLDAEATLGAITAKDLRDTTVAAFLGDGPFEQRGIVSLAAVREGAQIDERSIERAVRDALAADLPALDNNAEPATVDRLRPGEQHDGAVAEVRIDPDSGVLTMILSNGVVVHHKAMPDASSAVIVETTVAGGEINEHHGAPRGVTEAALSSWREPATARLSARDLADALVGTGIETRAYAEQDAVRLRVRAAGDHAQAAALLAAALLREPRVEPAAVERWKQSALEQASAGSTQPFDRLRRTLWTNIEGGDDPRVRFPEPHDIDRIDAPRAQAWLDQLLATGSVEIAIVGAVSREDAARMARDLFAGLTDRPQSDSRDDRPPPPARAPNSVRAHEHLESRSEHTAALVGVLIDLDPGADRWAACEIAARALTPRTRAALTGETAIANEPRTMWLPVHGWRGFSLLYTPIIAPTEAAQPTIDAAWSVYQNIARDGLSPSEMEEARESLRRSLASSMDDPEMWARTLSDALRRGHGVAAILDRRAAALRVSAEDVRSLIASSMERGSVRTVVTPRSPGAPDTTVSPN